MKLLRALPAALLAASAGGPAAAVSPIAEMLCQPTPSLVQKLTEQFGERRRATGLRGREQIMEVWTDEDGGWTLVVSYAHGTSCIVAMGEHWQEVRRDPA